MKRNIKTRRGRKGERNIKTRIGRAKGKSRTDIKYRAKNTWI